jgi:hypothetical protein
MYGRIVCSAAIVGALLVGTATVQELAPGQQNRRLRTLS